jgi:hypothetical protein
VTLELGQLVAVQRSQRVGFSESRERVAGHASFYQ